ncbi:MAG TPA: divergent PAP2 family protein [Bacillota bacterium]|nr:divergent PAP2 family protein [Bacillota bacterium]HOI37846.1 divergent PAP2 family protein [Bacillota bacterium]HPU74724.1 divergent PAP2 family protein [Bacillota bacterium]
MFSLRDGIFTNRILLAALISWAIAQTLKIFTSLRAEHRIDWSKIMGPGGMPSSHSAFVTSLAVGIGLTEGWDSGMFAVSFVFAAVVMYDAAGVRRAAGKQARVLNQLMTIMLKEGHVPATKLRELLGHTPFEVIMGALLGMLIAWLMLWQG